MGRCKERDYALTHHSLIITLDAGISTHPSLWVLAEDSTHIEGNGCRREQDHFRLFVHNNLFGCLHGILYFGYHRLNGTGDGAIAAAILVLATPSHCGGAFDTLKDIG
jgi:hypothetical protein